MKEFIKLPIPIKGLLPNGNDKRCMICSRLFSECRGATFTLTAGALLMSRTGKSGGMSERLRGFMSLSFHGRPGECEVFTSIEVVDSAPFGQFDLNFCSLRCLRLFFRDIVRLLKMNIANERTFQRSRCASNSRKAFGRKRNVPPGN